MGYWGYYDYHETPYDREDEQEDEEFDVESYWDREEKD